MLLLCEELSMVSYLKTESLLVLCTEVTPLGAKVQCHATQRTDAGFIERTVSSIGNLPSIIIARKSRFVSIFPPLMLIFVSVMDIQKITPESGHLVVGQCLLCIQKHTANISVNEVGLEVQSHEALVEFVDCKH